MKKETHKHIAQMKQKYISNCYIVGRDTYRGKQKKGRIIWNQNHLLIYLHRKNIFALLMLLFVWRRHRRRRRH